MMKGITKVIIVDDHALFREGVKLTLQDMEGIEIVGEAENGHEFLSLLTKVDPDIVLMDLRMPGMDGLKATEKAMKTKPSLKIIILSMFGEEEFLLPLINKGIAGYILKNAKIDEFETAINLIRSGQSYFSPQISQLLIKKIRQFTSEELPVFTPREIQVLQLLAKGYSLVEISKKLFISKRTVDVYKSQLMEKTNQHTVLNLVHYALKNKLAFIDEPGEG